MNKASHPQPILTPESAIGEAADTEMVERVMDALMAASQGHIYEPAQINRMSRAAIEAMREPTEAMVEAGCRLTLPAMFRHGIHGLASDGEGTRRSMAAVIRAVTKQHCAMISAALGKPA